MNATCGCAYRTPHCRSRIGGMLDRESQKSDPNPACEWHQINTKTADQSLEISHILAPNNHREPLSISYDPSVIRHRILLEPKPIAGISYPLKAPNFFIMYMKSEKGVKPCIKSGSSATTMK